MTQRERAVALRDEGLSVRQIAAKIGEPTSTVGDWIAVDRPTANYQRGGRHSYRLQASAQPKGEPPSSFKIVVPARLGRMIPPDMEFIPELTEDGILYRIVRPEPDPEVPSWLT